MIHLEFCQATVVWSGWTHNVLPIYNRIKEASWDINQRCNVRLPNNLKPSQSDNNVRSVVTIKEMTKITKWFISFWNVTATLSQSLSLDKNSGNRWHFLDCIIECSCIVTLTCNPSVYSFQKMNGNHFSKWSVFFI